MTSSRHILPWSAMFFLAQVHVSFFLARCRNNIFHVIWSFFFPITFCWRSTLLFIIIIVIIIIIIITVSKYCYLFASVNNLNLYNKRNSYFYAAILTTGTPLQGWCTADKIPCRRDSHIWSGFCLVASTVKKGVVLALHCWYIQVQSVVFSCPSYCIQRMYVVSFHIDAMFPCKYILSRVGFTSQLEKCVHFSFFPQLFYNLHPIRGTKDVYVPLCDIIEYGSIICWLRIDRYIYTNTMDHRGNCCPVVEDVVEQRGAC